MLLRRISIAAGSLMITGLLFAQVNPPAAPPGGKSNPAIPPGKATPPPAGKNAPVTGTPPTTTTATPTPSPIYRVDDVSRALTIDDRQRQRLDTMTQRLQEKYQTQYDRINSLPERERLNRRMQLDREYTNAWLTSAADVLNERQLQRYRQVQLQYGRFASFNDPAIQKELNLTDEQLTALGEALTWSNETTQEIMRQAQADPDRAQAAYTAYNKAYQDRLNRILTEEQQRQWMKMTGDPFPFPPPFGTGSTTTTPKR